MNPTKRIGEKIRELRKRMRMTQAELAGSDFTKSFISQVEKGITRPSLKSLEIIASRLNQPVTYFLDDSSNDADTTKNSSIVDSLIETASKLHLNGEFIEALDVYRDALNNCHASDLRRKGEIRLRTGHVYFSMGRYDVARDCFSLAKDDFIKSNASDFLARALSDLGTSFDHLGDYSSALECYREASKVIARDPIVNASYKATILANLGTVLLRMEKYDDAIGTLNQVIDHATKTGDYGQYGRCCDTLGHAYRGLGKFEEAILWARRAIDFFRSVRNVPRELHCLNNLASHLRESGNIDASKRTSQEALRLAEEHGIENEMARAHAGLAEVALDEGNIGVAYQSFTQAFTIAPTFPGASEWTSKVVECAKMEPVPPELLALIERLASTWKGSTRGLADIHSNLGKIYSMMGDTEKANQHLSRSVDLYRKS